MSLAPHPMQASAALRAGLPAAQPAAPHYRVFLSYSHADTRWANRLMRQLEGYRVSRRFHGRKAPIGDVGPRLAPVFRDREELATTSDLGESIRLALRESATLVVICSPASARSRWVQEEILMFKRLHSEDRVFAFIVAGEPKIAGAADDCFSPALRSRLGNDGRHSTQPAEVVAADARPHADGPKLAFVRLVAGLLGVGFDELRQRELQRRNRRLTIIAAAAGCGMAVTLGLAAVAWRARNDALLARNDAQRRQEGAEDVLAFMLGDFRGDLKKLGRLDLLGRVGDKAMAYFDALDARDVTDTALARQAKALTQIGEIRIEQKDARYADAGRAFFTAYQRAAALAARHPENGDMLFERAQAEYWIGHVHWKRGDLTQAGEWMTRYRDTATRLADLDPARVGWQGELAYGHHNLAVLDMDRGNFDAARNGFLAELAMLTRMSAARPEDPELQFRLTDVISWLGSLAERAGDFTTAAERLADQTRRLKALIQADPRTAKWQAKLADALALESSLLAITGRPAESLSLRQQARGVIEPMVAQDPANRTWLSALLNLALKEAMVLAAEGDLPGAARLVREARAGYERLAKAEPSARNFEGQLGTAWRLEAQLRHRTGRADAAEAAARALAIEESLLAKPSPNENLLGDYLQTSLLAGEIAAGLGDPSGASRRWQTALDAALPRLESSNNWRMLDPAARTLARLGRLDESRAIIGRLVRLGYQPLTPWPEVTRPTPLSDNHHQP